MLPVLGCVGAAIMYALKPENSRATSAFFFFCILVCGGSLWCALAGTLLTLVCFAEPTARPPSRGPLVVEGNIGAGKSTFLAQLGRGQLEDVEAWKPWMQAATDSGALADAFCLQVRILSDYVNQRAPISERSWCATLQFASINLGGKAPNYLDAYLGLVCQCVMSGALRLPSAVLYLETPADECTANLKTRNQAGDEHVSPEYLAQIEKGHAQLMKFYEALNVPIIYVRKWAKGTEEEICSSVTAAPPTIPAPSKSAIVRAIWSVFGKRGVAGDKKID